MREECERQVWVLALVLCQNLRRVASQLVLVGVILQLWGFSEAPNTTESTTTAPPSTTIENTTETFATWHTKSCWNCTAVAETCLRLTWNCNAWQGDKVHDIVHYVHAAYRQMWHVHIHRIGEVRSTTVVKTADGQHAQKACVQMILSCGLKAL